MRTADICPTCSTYSNALCTLYNGDYLSTIDVEPLFSVEESLIRINTWASTVGGQLTSLDESIELTTTTASMNFIGDGVTATTVGNDVTVTIPGGGGALVSVDVISSDTDILHEVALDIDIPTELGITDTAAMDDYGYFIDMRFSSASVIAVEEHWLYLHALNTVSAVVGEIDTVMNDYGQPLFSGGFVLGNSHPMYLRIRIPKGGLRASGIAWDVKWGSWGNRRLSSNVGTPLTAQIPAPTTPSAGTPVVYPTAQRGVVYKDSTVNDATGNTGSAYDAGSDAMGITSFTLNGDATKLRLYPSISPYNLGTNKIVIHKLVITPFL